MKLFAVLHDSKRINDGHDPEHGPRAASFAAKLRGEAFELTDSQFHILQAACAGHTNKLTHPDITVQTCFDADRLDLISESCQSLRQTGRGRQIGTRRRLPTPNRRVFCHPTFAIRKSKTINWAVGRGSLGFVPDFVRDVWSIG